MTPTVVVAAASGDFDGDGRPDLAVADVYGEHSAVFAVHGDGTLGEPSVSFQASGSVGVGDFNGDGKLDFVSVGYDAIHAWLGNGNGTFAAATRSSLTDAAALSVADLDGDGKLDVLVGSWTAISLLRGKGDGSFLPAVVVAPAVAPRDLTTADLDGDGKLDIAVANHGKNRATVIRGHGDGTFDAPADYVTGVGPTGIVVADLDSDGRLDLATTNDGAKDVSILHGAGDGTFGAAQHLVAADMAPMRLVAVDLDDDGRTDLALTIPILGVVRVFFNRAGGPSSPVDYAVPARTLAVGDFNQDGRPDLAAIGSKATILPTTACLP